MIYKYDTEVKLTLSDVCVWNFYIDQKEIINDLHNYFYLKKNINSNFYEEDGELISKNKYLFLDTKKLSNEIVTDKFLIKELQDYLENYILNEELDFFDFTKLNEHIKNMEKNASFIKFKDYIINYTKESYLNLSYLTPKMFSKLLTLDQTNIDFLLIIYINKILLENKSENIIIYLQEQNDILFKYISEINKNNIFIVFDNENILSLERNLFKGISFILIYENFTNELKLKKDYDDFNVYLFSFNKKVIMNKNMLNENCLKIINAINNT